MKTKFIVGEGIDGSGKTTFLSRVKEALESHGVRVGTIKSLLPDTIISKAIREWIAETDKPKSNEMIVALYTTAIIEANSKLVEMMNSNEYDVIISDRWLFSTYVYGLHGEWNPDTLDLCYHMLEATNTFINKPDLSILVSCEPEVAISRIMVRDNKLDNDIFTNVEKLTAYDKTYKNIFSSSNTDLDKFTRSYMVVDNSKNELNSYDMNKMIDGAVHTIDSVIMEKGLGC